MVNSQPEYSEPNEQRVPCDYAIRNLLQGMYPGIVFCQERFEKGSLCPEGQKYLGVVDLEGKVNLEGGSLSLNICPVKGLVLANRLKEKVMITSSIREVTTSLVA